ncbi:hypothetical protein [Sandarakinorhabdus sp.]|uniref:hypothetical protein n=1 Tax=Sandarakinorhabdus sp. TaxID=1916663 RepID=UPI00333E25FA
MRFTRFVGIDWSGAKGARHPSIQIAVCAAGDAPPQLVVPAGGVWSRRAALDWLGGLAGDVLVGMDAGFGFAAVPPFDQPARSLWAEVEAVCADEVDLGAHGFIAHRRDSFWLGAADGPRADRAHLRLTEQVYKASGLGVPTSNFVLLGASQVGKATLTAMRVLHRLDWSVWPFDPLPAAGPVILEIYAQAFARQAGFRGKLRDVDSLNLALARHGSRPMPGGFSAIFPDHVGDAIVTAAGLRAIAHQPHWWHPQAMTPQIAVVEGWTFGVV